MSGVEQEAGVAALVVEPVEVVVGGDADAAEALVALHLDALDLAQLQQALLRADGAGAPFGTADSAEKDGIGGFSGGKGFICEGRASFVNGAL